MAQVPGAARGATAEIRHTQARFQMAGTRKNFGHQITVALPDTGVGRMAIAVTRRFTAACQTEIGGNEQRTSTNIENAKTAFGRSLFIPSR